MQKERKREFVLRLSDSEIDDLYQRAGSVNLFPEELIEFFIGDLLLRRLGQPDETKEVFLHKWFKHYRDKYESKTFLKYAVDHNFSGTIAGHLHTIKSYKDNAFKEDEFFLKSVKSLDKFWNDFLNWTDLDASKLDRDAEFEKVRVWDERMDFHLKGRDESMERGKKEVQAKNVPRPTAPRR